MAERNDIDDDHQKEGYDVEFVDKISTDEITCAICLHIFRKPVQAVPCGHRFCKNCINKVQRKGPNNNLVCPNDRREVQIFADVGREREILNFQVKCTNHKLSCEWTGELRGLEIHLQECQFLYLECENRCGKNNILRKQMLYHLKSECPKYIFPCKYEKLGCQFKGNKGFLSEHLKESIDKHLTLQMEQQERQKEEISQQRTTIQQLTLDTKQQGKTIRDLHKQLNDMVNLVTTPKGPLTFKIEYFRSLFTTSKILNEPTYLDSFYFLNGYRGRFYVYLNGENTGNNTHMSVYFQIMKGPFDDVLEWPMTFATATISLIINGNCKMKVTFDCKEKEEILKTAFTKPIEEKGGIYGWPNFFQHKEIPKNINGDAIELRICINRL